MAAHLQQAITQWNNSLFSFKVTRDSGFQFRNRHFEMIGLTLVGKALMRADSIASPNHAEALE